jgi:hypothetical protein
MLTQRLGAVAVLGLVLGLAPATAQEGGSGYSAIIDNVDLLVDNYARFLTRKYDMTDEQDVYTRELLRERTYAFLDKHETDLRSLMDQMFEARSGGEMNPADLVEWGKRVMPIYEEAQKLIVDGNSDWRGILNEEQKKIHDEDLAMMERSFGTTDEAIERIVSGAMTVEEFRSPRWLQGNQNNSSAARRSAQERAEAARQRAEDARRRREELEAARAEQRAAQPEVEPVSDPQADVARADAARHRDLTRPPADRAAREAMADATGEGKERAPVAHADPVRGVTPRERAANRGSRTDRETPRPTPPPARSVTRAPGKDYEGEWDRYVADFIKKYGLNDEQKQKAEGILKDCKSQAERYLTGKQADMERLDAEEAKLKAATDKEKAQERSKALAEINKQRTEMREPVSQIFERQLKPKLERLPTRAQRRDAEAAAKQPAAKSEKP